MARKGKIPISLPKGVEVKVTDSKISVKGPKGTIEEELLPCIDVQVNEEDIIVALKEDATDDKKFHGLFRTLIENMVHGTTKGFEKQLEMIGVGYRATVQGQNLNLQVGFSHPTNIPIPSWAEVKVEKNTKITISGVDKQKVGQFAAAIRCIRPPEPYQGKGIRYKNEYVRRKAGKAAAKK